MKEPKRVGFGIGSKEIYGMKESMGKERSQEGRRFAEERAQTKKNEEKIASVSSTQTFDTWRIHYL